LIQKRHLISPLFFGPFRQATCLAARLTTPARETSEPTVFNNSEVTPTNLSIHPHPEKPKTYFKRFFFQTETSLFLPFKPDETPEIKEKRKPAYAQEKNQQCAASKRSHTLPVATSSAG